MANPFLEQNVAAGRLVITSGVVQQRPTKTIWPDLNEPLHAPSRPPRRGNCEIAPKCDPSGERSYVFEYTCESVFGNRVAFRAKLDPSKFAILIVK